MQPLIHDGSYIVVEPRETEIVSNKIYVLEYDNETFIKRIIVNDEIKAIILKSINSEYDDIFITGEKLNNLVVKGRAVKFILDGKL